MADKLRDVFPIPVDFSKGEQPSSDKFTGWATQTNAGLQMLETSVGNLWGDQANYGGSIFFDPGRFNSNAAGAGSTPPARPPMIANLARLIGPSSALNPMREGSELRVMVQLTRDDIPADVTEFVLPYPAIRVGSGFPASEYVVDDSSWYTAPTGTITSVLEAISTAASDSVFVSFKASKALVTSSGHYTIDIHGRVYTYNPTGTYTAYMQAADTVGVHEYETTIFPDAYQQASMNVIPDLEETTAGRLCLVTRTATGNNFDVEFPYVRVLPRKREDGAAPYQPGHPLGTDGVSGGYPAGWDGVSASKYRPLVPQGIRHLNDGDQIPDGFMYLWDTYLGTGDPLEDVGGSRIDGLTFYMGPNNYTVRISGADLDGVPAIISSINQDRYRIVTVGCTVTESIADLRWRHDTHDHSGVLSQPIEHSSLSNNAIGRGEIDSVYSFDASSAKSQVVGNDHPQYVSRYGYVPSSDLYQHDGAILGDQFMAAARTDYNTGIYTSSSYDSRVFYFGSPGVSIRATVDLGSNSVLQLRSSNESEIWLKTKDTIFGDPVSGVWTDLGLEFHGSSSKDGEVRWYASSVTENGFAFLQDSSVVSAFVQMGTLCLASTTAPDNIGSPTGNYIKASGFNPEMDFVRSAGGSLHIDVNGTGANLLTTDATLGINIATATTPLTLTAGTGADLSLTAGNDVNVSATGDFDLDSSGGNIEITSVTGTVDLASAGLTTLTGVGGVTVTGTSDVTLETTGAGDIILSPTAGGDILLNGPVASCEVILTKANLDLTSSDYCRIPITSDPAGAPSTTPPTGSIIFNLFNSKLYAMGSTGWVAIN